MAQTSYITKIVTGLSKLVASVGNPDQKHNQGKLLAEAYLWDSIVDYAKKKSDKAWRDLEHEEIVVTEGLDPGEHELAESPHFVCKAVITQPVHRFNADAMAAAMKAKFKCSEPTAKQMIEDAKKPTKSQVRLSIEEKGAV